LEMFDGGEISLKRSREERRKLEKTKTHLRKKEEQVKKKIQEEGVSGSVMI